MATFIAITTSNQPGITNPDKVRQVLERYVLDGEVQAVLCPEEDRLAIWGYDWPVAWKLPEGSGSESCEPDWDQDGDDGFEQLLKDLAPFLAESLIVQAVGAEACRYPLSACQWIIQPGESQVTISGFQDLPPAKEPSQGDPCQPTSCWRNAS